jgi:hypothetical protein
LLLCFFGTVLVFFAGGVVSDVPWGGVVAGMLESLMVGWLLLAVAAWRAAAGV